MNAAINFSIPDGWVAEFAKHEHNAFVIDVAHEFGNDKTQKDRVERLSMYKILNEVIIPCYYTDEEKWLKIISNSMKEVVPQFDSARMITEYYDKMY